MIWLWTWMAILGGVPLVSDSGQPTYVLAIGNNELPVSGAQENLARLRYADDDAAAFCAYTKGITDKIMLLTTMDDLTQRRFPDMAAQARPPTMQELKIAVSGLAWQIMQDRKNGKEPVVFISYSGHGYMSSKREPSLAMLDGAITREFLYDEVLAKLPATYVHLLVDACYAEAIVRPRGADLSKKSASARHVKLGDEDRLAWLSNKTLGRFPNVGVVMATGTHQEAHEWDAIRQGVFTYEVLSGLRGAADVNGDKKIEYSELHAFLTAANRDVKDIRARLQPQIWPPTANQKVALVDLSQRYKEAWFIGMMGSLGHFFVEDERGNRLVEMRAEQGYEIRLSIPASQKLFLASDKGDANMTLAPGEEKNALALSLAAPVIASRGSMESSLFNGLYRTPYGPMYYRGFVDRIGVIPANISDRAAGRVSKAKPSPSSLPAWISWGSAGALLVVSAVSGGMAIDARNDWQTTDYQKQAAQAKERYDLWRTTFFCSSAGAIAAGVLGLVLYPWDEEDSSNSPSSTSPSMSVGPTGVQFRIQW